MQQPAYAKEIIFDRETRDYALYLDGALVGFARTFYEAETTLNELVDECLRHEQVVSADAEAEYADTQEATMLKLFFVVAERRDDTLAGVLGDAELLFIGEGGYHAYAVSTDSPDALMARWDADDNICSYQEERIEEAA